MLPTFPSSFLVLICLFAGPSSAATPSEATPSEAIQEPDDSAPPAPVAGPESGPVSQLSWSEMVSRDRRVSFTRRSGHDARVELASQESTEQGRALSLIAMGSTHPQMVRERPSLEAFATSGQSTERLAAILALGEFGEGAEAALQAQLTDSDQRVRGCAMLALLKTGRSSARRNIERIAALSEEDSRLASQLLVFAVDPSASERTVPAELLLEWRWESARKYGLIDGESWSTRALSRLIETPRFLDAVILGSISSSTVLGVKDHLLSSLINEGGNAELRAATAAMPKELAALIESGLWNPNGVRGWRIILEEVDDRGLENDCLSLLSLALEVPEVQVRALMLLARGGLPEPLIGLEDEWPNLKTGERVLACEAWALAENSDVLDFLREFEDDEQLEPAVRASLMLAMARLGDLEAHAKFKAIMDDPEDEAYRVTLDAALEQGDAPLIRTYLEGLLETIKGEDRLKVARALAEAGVALGRTALAEELKDGFPRGREGVRCVRALVGRDASAHLKLFRETFPVEDDLPLNIELARAIIEAQDDYAMRYVRPALWTGPFDRSVLAALVILRMQGLYGLRDELTRIPVGASTKDIRRVGFALGQWGGIAVVDNLRERHGLLPRNPILQGALLGAIGRRTH